MMTRSDGSGKRPFGYFLLELVLIFVSVFLAFSVSQWQSAHRDRKLADTAIHNIAHEILDNIETIDTSMAVHEDLVPAMRQIPDSAFTGKTAFYVFLSTLNSDSPNIPLLQRSAFDAAIASGAVQQIDYDVLASISSLYNGQTTAFGISVSAVSEFVRNADMFKESETKPQIQALTLVFQNLLGNEIYYAHDARSVLTLLNDTYDLGIEIPSDDSDTED